MANELSTITLLSIARYTALYIAWKCPIDFCHTLSKGVTDFHGSVVFPPALQGVAASTFAVALTMQLYQVVSLLSFF